MNHRADRLQPLEYQSVADGQPSDSASSLIILSLAIVSGTIIWSSAAAIRLHMMNVDERFETLVLWTFVALVLEAIGGYLSLMSLIRRKWNWLNLLAIASLLIVIASPFAWLKLSGRPIF